MKNIRQALEVLKIDIRLALPLSLALTFVLLFVALIVFCFLPTPNNEIIVKFYTFKFEIIKAIFIGFLISALGIIFPEILSAKKYDFELEREGRRLYSEVKTGIEYLPYKLPFLNPKESIELIEKLHQIKHLADLYKDSEGVYYKEKLENKLKVFHKLKALKEEIIKDEYINSSQREKLERLEKIIA